MKRTILTAAALAVLAGAAWAQADPVRELQKKVEAVAKKVSDAFVYIGGGSAVLISADGWFLTNHHVGGTMAKGTDVYLSDGRRFRADLVCTDAVGDVALFTLKDVKEELPFVEIGDSDTLEVGQYVVAVGNPFGLALPAPDRRRYPSVSVGVVSALHRFQQTYSDCIQTDAAVNPGNSGGPLVTLDGKLVGINGRIATRYMNRVNSGVGYAIATRQIKRFLPQMMEGGISGKIFHGQVNGLVFDSAPSQGLGAKVRDVRSGSSAEKHGFKAGDLIVKVEEYPIFSAARFLGVLGNWPMESEISVVVKRGGREETLKVVLDKYSGADIFGQAPDQGRRPKGSGYLGVVIEDTEQGTVFSNVVEDSPAAKAGIRQGDQVLTVDGRKVMSRTTILERIWARKPGEKMKLKIKRGEEELEVEVELAKHPED
jgi:S1-C subfamily serine protease